MDTHVAIWCLAAPDWLSPSARALLEDPAQSVCFSSISIVEFELKQERLRANYAELGNEFAQQLVSHGFTALAFTAADATGLASVRPNRDPFDRMLCAQSLARGMTLVTADRALQAYEPIASFW